MEKLRDLQKLRYLVNSLTVSDLVFLSPISVLYHLKYPLESSVDSG